MVRAGVVEGVLAVVVVVAAEEGDGGPEPAPAPSVAAAAPPSAGWQNSLMVTVRRFVVTSVTTTLAQRGGAISGRQSGSPSTGARAVPSAAGGAPSVVPAAAGWDTVSSGEAAVAVSGCWLAVREPPRTPRLPVVEGPKRRTPFCPSSSSTDEEEDREEDSEGEQGRKAAESGTAAVWEAPGWAWSDGAAAAAAAVP